MSEQSISIDREVQALSRIADRPNLQALAYALRHPETWPGDFVWDYRECTCCAIGLSLRLWPKMDLPNSQPARQTWIAREMAMSYREAKTIFFELAPVKTVIVKHGWFRKKTSRRVYQFACVTPDHVADAIDRYLATDPETTPIGPKNLSFL